MFVDKSGHFYFGDLQPGDRVATQEEEVTQFKSQVAAELQQQQDKMADKESTITDPYVTAVANLTRAEIISTIDNAFSALIIQQRNILKALALTCRVAIRNI